MSAVDTCSELASDEPPSTNDAVNSPGTNNSGMLATQSSHDSCTESNVLSVEKEGESFATASIPINPLINASISTSLEIEALVEQKLETLRRLKEERQSFMEKMDQAEAEVNRIVEHLCGMVDNKANELLSTASSVRADSLAKFEQTRVELESKASTMRINEEYVQQLLSSASPEDLIKLAPAVQLMKKQFERENEHAEQMLATTVGEEQIASLNQIAEFDFASLLGNTEGENLLGDVSVSELVDDSLYTGSTAPYLGTPQSLLVLSTGSSVRGLAFLRSRLYVLLERCSLVDVRDCETEDCGSVEQIVVEQLTYPDCIVASETSHSVFVSDCQISGLFQIVHHSGTSSVSLIPLEDIPSGLSLSSSGHLVFTYAHSKTVIIASPADVSLLQSISASDLLRPIRASPVPGEGNGILVCDETDKGLIWFLCGHRFEGAVASQLEEPLQLYQLSGLSCLISDSFGRYIGLSSLQGSVTLFDATFSINQCLVTGPNMSCIALNPLKGLLFVGHLDGTIKLFRVIQTRRQIQINLRKLT